MLFYQIKYQIKSANRFFHFKSKTNKKNKQKNATWNDILIYNKKK